MFRLSDLQAVEPESLKSTEGVLVEISEERDPFAHADLVAASAEEIAEYVREHWGDDDGDWFANYVVARIIEVPADYTEYRFPGNVERFDADSHAFLASVEDAWTAETKGELWLTALPESGLQDEVDTDLATLISRLAEATAENIRLTAAEQIDAAGNTLDNVTAAEIARRVVVALNVLFYGGR